MIGKWLERRVERRVEEVLEERAGYGDLVLSGLESIVSGDTANVLRTTAMESASGMWARALAAATVTGDRGALTRRVRHMIGRSLIRAGEIVFAIRVDAGRVVLDPCSTFEVLPDWRYRVEVPEPGGRFVAATHPREGVCHFIWTSDAREPWRGRSPLGSASLGGRLAANVESKLADETGAPSALILPVPSDGGAPALQQIRQDIAGRQGEGRASRRHVERMGRRDHEGDAARLAIAASRADGPERAEGAVRGRSGPRSRRLRHPGQPWARGRRRDRTERVLSSLDHVIGRARGGADCGRGFGRSWKRRSPSTSGGCGLTTSRAGRVRTRSS